MKKLIFFALSIFLVTSIVYSLQSNPSSIDADVYAGVPYETQIALTNDFSYPIFNLTLEETQDITFNKINKLEVNETRNTTITVLTSAKYETTRNPKIRFDYYTDVPQDPDLYEVNITSYSFIPSPLEILENDRIKWFNSDTYEHRVRQENQNISPTFDFTLQQDQYSEEITFNTVGTITYYEVFGVLNIFSGQILVRNRTTSQLTTNPDLYLPLNIHISSELVNTSVTLDVLDTNFTINYNETEEGALRVSSGSEKAFNIHFEGEWMEFMENDFNLEKNSNNLLLFRIRPIILDTDETNKTYTKTIRMTGSNFEEKTQDISIFIPYKNIPKVENATTSELIEEILRLKELLDKYNFSTEEPRIIYKDPEININMSASEVRDLLLNLRGLFSTVERNANIQKATDDEQNVKLGGINETQGSILNTLDRISERMDKQSVLFWGVFGTIIILICVWAIFNYIGGYQRTKFQEAVYFSRKKK